MAISTTVCNEPIATLKAMRSPKIWLTMLAPDLPGKRVLVEIQLNHGLTEEEKPLLDQKLLTLYTNVITKFAKLHGDSTKCFLVRAPETVDLVGLHVQEFGGATNGFACLETVFCVAPRTDGKVLVSHVEDAFPAAEFELAGGLPKTRVINWAAHVEQQRAGFSPQGAPWATAIKGALQYYVNRHKGPTGQIEVPVGGLSIVVGSILPEGATTHCETTLAAAALISQMAVTGEWGKVPLGEFTEWLSEAEMAGSGRRANVGTILFGMPQEVIHIEWNPPRPKGHALAAGSCFLIANTGLPDTNSAAYGRMRATTTHVAFAYFRQALQDRLAATTKSQDVLLRDDVIYDLLRGVPQAVSRKQALEQIKSGPAREHLQTLFKTHDEPAGGYAAREKLLFVLAEMQRADRAKGAIRKGDAADLGALMNVGQTGEARLFHELTPGGIVEATHSIPATSSDEELNSLADHADSLWRQSGCSGASTPETDLLCDLAGGVSGVMGVRWTTAQKVVILVKNEVLSVLRDRLAAGYYVPRKLPQTLLMQVYPARGAGILDV